MSVVPLRLDGEQPKQITGASALSHFDKFSDWLEAKSRYLGLVQIIVGVILILATVILAIFTWTSAHSH